MFSDKNRIKTWKTFSSVDNIRYMKVLQKKAKALWKLLKIRTAKSEAEYKTYKNMFERLKLQSKRN